VAQVKDHFPISILNLLRDPNVPFAISLLEKHAIVAVKMLALE
jgi:hypothetical protein